MNIGYMDPFRQAPSYQAVAQYGAHSPYQNMCYANTGPGSMPYWPASDYQRAMLAHHVHPKQPDPKPRLAKDEVDLLEREFAKNPKPNSTTKRELADRMRVEVPRINNWFQNRRAKEKQLRKTAEFEAQKRESEASEDASPDESSMAEFFSLSNTHHELGPNRATFGDDQHEPAAAEDEADVDGDADAKVDQRQQPAEEALDSDLEASAHAVSSSPKPEAPNTPTPTAFPPPLHASGFPHEFGQLGSDFDAQASQGDMLSPADLMDSLSGGDHFPLAGATLFDKPSGLDEAINLDHPSPPPLPPSPHSIPTLLQSEPLRFKEPPPPANIAGRRNTRQPAPLAQTALRSASASHGQRTGGYFDQRHPESNALRRIASASGMSGRVQKQSAGSGPRSPYPAERAQELLYRYQRSTRSPSIPTLGGSAMSPVTPDGTVGYGLGEPTATTSPSDDGRAYTCSPLEVGCGMPFLNTKPHLQSSPATPGLQLSNFDENYLSSVAGPSTDQGWPRMAAPSDEPLSTPNYPPQPEFEYAVTDQQHFTYLPPSQPGTPSYEHTRMMAAPFPYGNDQTAQIMSDGRFMGLYPNGVSGQASAGPAATMQQLQFRQPKTPATFGAH